MTNTFAVTFVAKNIYHLSNKMNKIIIEQSKKGFGYDYHEISHTDEEDNMFVLVKFSRGV